MPPPENSHDRALLAQEDELRHRQPAEDLAFATQGGHGVLERSPEDSVYYHPTLNPSGQPPAGKPQRYKTSTVAPSANALAALPKPKPPPLPAGPAPQQNGALPPPAGSPPGHFLPPPAGPPPGMLLALV